MGTNAFVTCLSRSSLEISSSGHIQSQNNEKTKNYHYILWYCRYHQYGLWCCTFSYHQYSLWCCTCHQHGLWYYTYHQYSLWCCTCQQHGLWYYTYHRYSLWYCTYSCDAAHANSTVCDTTHIGTVCDTALTRVMQHMPSARFVILHISSVQSVIQHTPSLHRLQQWYCMGNVRIWK